jgi:hypothetical protein
MFLNDDSGPGLLELPLSYTLTALQVHVHNSIHDKQHKHTGSDKGDGVTALTFILLLCFQLSNFDQCVGAPHLP